MGSIARQIPDAAKARQTTAADPEHSVFVSANAGSGKTHVLVQRVINLLLRGEDPAKILCITFTKAAAATMATRVFDTLAKWTALDDAALDENIRLVTGKTADATQRAIARRLFANALETPGGLKVQTIHAFCTRLLHQFPFEADVAARFDVLDETATAQLLNELTLEVLLKGATEAESPLGNALSTAITEAADTTFKEVIAETIGKRDLITEWTARAGGVGQAIDELSRTFRLAAGDSLTAVETEYFSGASIPESEWPALIKIFSAGSNNDKERADSLSAALRSTGSERLENYLDIFCTGERKGRANVLTRRLAEANPQWAERLNAEKDRVCHLLAREFALRARDRSAALITVAAAVIERYQAEKDRRGLLDYEDLIDKTLELLNNVSAAWVHYKLDRGIHHLLIDEAQDTSPKQWEIVKALVGEFFAGEGAHDRRRTIFAVGDEKQSIFSFQGAAPREFAAMRTHFQALHQKSQLNFLTTEFKHSFRSGENVLGAVDTVFQPPAAHAGLTALPEAPVHEALPQAAPGLVEIWDTTKTDERKDMTSWDAPFDTERSTSGVVKLAKRIARHVALWRSQGRLAKDVLILVRRRGVLFESIIRALKNEGVPVAGADRLMLTEHIAVMDLMALADALLLPQDDLALATVLKSPLFGISETELFDLAHGRKTSLRAVLRAQRPELAARLDQLRERARDLTPFAFYAELLGAEGARRKLLERLGHEASDALDEFLNLALDYERLETPSLQGFVAWLRSAQVEVKRDMEMARDEVRVMTVHGAKGLEAPIVILADTTTPPQGFHPPRLLQLATGAAPPLVWGVSKVHDAGPMSAARETALNEARDEYRRLLYVAMTRAIDRLIVCGVDGLIKRPQGCWYDLARDALESHCATEPADDGEGTVLRYRKIAAAAVPAAPPKAEALAFELLPTWLNQHVADAVTTAPIKPSGFADDHRSGDWAGAREARQRAILRGNIVHRLMQSLPDIAPERRADAASRHVARQHTDFSASEQEAIAGQALAILDDPQFAPLFAPGSRAEVPIVGRVDGRPITGVVDRLVVSADEILIADYKTNRPAPRNLAETTAMHSGYIRQLALYRAVLSRLYPGRHVRTALVWTDIPALAEIPPESLDAALASLTTP
jgi:ATP-dependent helicase/nuclease subunit A